MTGPTPPSPSAAGWLPRPAEEVFGEGASASEAYELLTVDVPAARWTEALTAARDELGCTYFDWLSAVDEPGTGISVCAHLVALGTPVRRLLVRTLVPHDAPELPTATGVYAGAAWHERETHEMFGVAFTGHPNPAPLLLPEGFEGHPLRKDFVLAARVAKAWPGAKEPGEPSEGGPRRRQALPPGVPDPNEWGPLRGQLPAAPARPARGRAAGTADAGAPGTAGERRPRRMRSASAGSASQRAAAGASASPAEPSAPAGPPEPGDARPGRPARRTRSAAEGSASRRAAAEPGRRSTDAPWLKPSDPARTPASPERPEPAGETSAEAARRVHERDEQAETPPAEGGGASVANAPEGDGAARPAPGPGGDGDGDRGGDGNGGDGGDGDGDDGGDGDGDDGTAGGGS